MNKEIEAIAIADGEENTFYFKILDNATDKEISDKAFEIAYCKYINLDEVKIQS